MRLKVKIFYISTCLAFFNGGAESGNPAFILFQPPEAGANDFAGICISASEYT